MPWLNEMGHGFLLHVLGTTSVGRSPGVHSTP